MTLWTQLLGCEIRYVGGSRTRLLQAGDGEPVLLLHGQGGSLENFRHNIPVLARHFRTTAIDLLWHGCSAKPPVDPKVIPLLVGQAVEVIEEEGLAPCHVIGQSMGGWVAASLAVARPDLVRSLVLVTPMGISPKAQPPDRAMLARALDAQLQALGSLSLAAVRSRMELLFNDPGQLDDEIVELRHKIFSDTDANRALRDLATAYLGGEGTDGQRVEPDDVDRLRVPVLLYWGTGNLGGAAAGRALAAAIPHAEYHCADVGHWAQYENAEEHNRVVVEFLRRHGGGVPIANAGAARGQQRSP